MNSYAKRYGVGFKQEESSYKVTFGDTTYTQLCYGPRITDKYQTLSPSGQPQIYTMKQILAKHFADSYLEASDMKVRLPACLLRFSLTTRKLLYRYGQLHLLPDTIKPLPDYNLAGFLTHELDRYYNADFSGDMRQCLTVTDGDYEKAAAMYFYHGSALIPEQISNSFATNSYSIKVKDIGTGVEISYADFASFQAQFRLAEIAIQDECTKIRAALGSDAKTSLRPTTWYYLTSIAMRTFYNNNGYRISLTEAAVRYFHGRIYEAIPKIVAATLDDKSYEPLEIVLPPYITDIKKCGEPPLVVPYSDFIIEQMPTNQTMRVFRDHNIDNMVEAAYRFVQRNPESQAYTSYSYQELAKMMHHASLDNFIRFGLIVPAPGLSFFYNLRFLEFQSEEELKEFIKEKWKILCKPVSETRIPYRKHKDMAPLPTL